MTGLTVNGDRHFRFDPLIHRCQFIAAGMAGDVNEMVLLRNHADTRPREIVLHFKDRDIIARNDPRGEDHCVSFLQDNVPMGIRRDAGKCRPRFPLRSGAQEQDFVFWQIARILRLNKRRQVFQVACVARRCDHSKHGPAGKHDMPAVCFRCTNDAFQPGHVRSKCCDDNAPVQPAYEIRQTGRHICFGACLAGREYIGAVADNGADALFPNFGQSFAVERLPDNRARINFPVAGYA